MAKFSTTTWPKRHTATFLELSRWLNQSALTDSPKVLEIGPGAVSCWLKDRLSAGEGHELSWLANRYRAFLRNLDGIIRRLPYVDLTSYEPAELLSVLPKKISLYVADISPNVIAAIKKQYPNVHASVFDFTKQSFSPRMDAIVCLCVLVRAEKPEVMFEKIYDSLKPGGILVMDNRSCSNFNRKKLPLKPLTSQLWQKPSE
jgi:SAM-dependent methyltransferase